MRLEHNPETHQVVLWTMGEAHVDVLLDRLRDRYGVTVEPSRCGCRCARRSPRRPRATAGTSSRAAATASTPCATSTVEPLPRGGGFEFVDKVVGGAVPRQFIPSVEKGVRAQLERGCLAGYPVVDIRVTLIDGKAHSVDSSDMAFQTAGALALREAATEAAVALLEPVDTVEVVVDDEYVGPVMSDLSTRRGRVLGHRAGRDRPDAGACRGAADRDRPLRDRPALAVARHGTFTRERIGTSRCPPTSPRPTCRTDGRSDQGRRHRQVARPAGQASTRRRRMSSSSSAAPSSGR